MPEPSGPNNVPGAATLPAAFHDLRGDLYLQLTRCQRQIIDVPPLSTCHEAYVHDQALDRLRGQCSLERR